MKKSTIVYLLAATSCYFIICGHSGGPDAISGWDCTGAETGLGNPTGCTTGTGCHSTSATTGIALALELDSVGVPTTHYTGGKNYTIKITGTNNTTNTQPKFGFQMGAIVGSSAVTTPINAGTFPSPYPANVHYTAPSSSCVVGIVEHGARLLPTSGTGGNGTIYSETINWTAPVAGTGVVSIWSALNAVNANNLADAGDLWNVNHVVINEWTTTGVASLEQNSVEMTIFPNPFSETTTLRITNPLITNFEIKIYDVAGKEVHAEIIRNSDSFVIRRGDLSSGIYFLKMTAGDKVSGRKFIVQ